MVREAQLLHLGLATKGHCGVDKGQDDLDS